MNGTYTYTAVAPAGYYSVNGTGNVSMPRAEALDLVFEPVLYNATINESGLPHGTVWWFNSSEFPNAPIVAPNGVVLSLGDGGYPYAVGVAPDWSARPSDGILHVNGSSTALTVLFAPAPVHGHVQERRAPRLGRMVGGDRPFERVEPRERTDRSRPPERNLLVVREREQFRTIR